MTAEMWAALLASVASLGTVIRWTVGRWENGEKLNRESLQRMTDALIANTASNAVLIIKMDQLVASNTALASKVDEISDFVEEHTPVRRTPPRGIRVPRAGSHHDDNK